MKERPILFSDPMVRAILEERKTMTRRIVKLNTAGRIHLHGKQWHPEDENCLLGCPKGVVGDRLWVREAFGKHRFNGAPIHYRATEPQWKDKELNPNGKWRPSIHMFRVDSRITLEITGVRIERLWAITAADAEKEGAKFFTGLPRGPWLASDCGWSMEVPETNKQTLPSAKQAFGNFWQKINGVGSFAKNPLVWVIIFKVL